MAEPTPYARMAIALAALIGLFDSLYLSIEHSRGAALICPTGGGCAIIAASPYSLLFGVLPIAYLGVVAYTLIVALALLSLQRRRVFGLVLPPLLLGIASVGTLFALYLVYLQIGVIGAICFWCMVSAVTQALIWLAALLNWRADRLQQAMRMASIGTSTSAHG